MLVFAHVPKTGGTSITAILLRFLTACGASPESVLLYGTMIPYSDLAPLDQLPGRIQFLAGHFREPHYDKLLPHKPFVIASARDPFERFCSGLEHFERLRQAGETTLHRYQRTSRLLEDLAASRGNRQATCEAILRYQREADPYRGLRRILLYQDRFVADARIESTEIDRLCRMLATQSPKRVIDCETLRGVSRQNVWPQLFFNRFCVADRALLRECFDECFGDTNELVRAFRDQTPSLFAPAIWQLCCQRLGLQEPVA